MFKFIDYAIAHARLTIATLLFLLVAGLVAYVTIPKEAEPDVKVPIIYVQLSQRGISPEDAERLLLRPVETQLKSVGNVKEMRATAFQGGARRRARQGRPGQARPAEGRRRAVGAGRAWPGRPWRARRRAPRSTRPS